MEPRNPEIQPDEEWKERVRAEAAAADVVDITTNAAGDAPPAEPRRSTPRIDPSHLPAASLATLVSMLGTQAMVALGVLPNPVTSEHDPQPALARHFIDLIAMLQEKTKENCTIDEQRMLNSTLHELRMAFLQLAPPGRSGQG